MKMFFSKCFPINPKSLKDIRSFTRIFFQQINISTDQIEDLVLVLMEAVSNVMKHAYGNKISEEMLKIKINLKDQKLIIIEILDKGKFVKIEDLRSRNLSDIRAGGLGLFFIGEIMDKIEFMKNKDGEWNNHLVISKKIINQPLYPC